MWILWWYLQSADTTAPCFSGRKSTFHELNRLYIWWEMGGGLIGTKNCRDQKKMQSFSLHPWLSVYSDKPSSGMMRHTRTHMHITFNRAVPCSLLSPYYSRLEPMLLSLILSVQELWGNSDISVWCLPYVSGALPGPIKLIFNVCPTLDRPSQGWHSSRGDIITRLVVPSLCIWLFPVRPLGEHHWCSAISRLAATPAVSRAFSSHLRHQQLTSNCPLRCQQRCRF